MLLSNVRHAENLIDAAENGIDGHLIGQWQAAASIALEKLRGYTSPVATLAMAELQDCMDEVQVELFLVR